MKLPDNRSDSVKLICSTNITISCVECPLFKPCQPVVRDSKEAFDIRMNTAAEELK